MPPRFSHSIIPDYEPDYMDLIEKYYRETILPMLSPLKHSLEYFGDVSEAEQQETMRDLTERLEEEMERLQFTTDELRELKPIVENWEEFTSDSDINDVDTSKIVLRDIHLKMKNLHIEVVEKYHQALNRGVEEDADNAIGPLSADFERDIKSRLIDLEQLLEKLKIEAVDLEQEITKLSDVNLATDAESSDIEADEEGRDPKRARGEEPSEAVAGAAAEAVVVPYVSQNLPSQ